MWRDAFKGLYRFLQLWVGIALAITVILPLMAIAGLFTFIQVGQLVEQYGQWVWVLALILFFSGAIALHVFDDMKPKAPPEKRKCISAFTEQVPCYPGYISFNRKEDGMVEITLRERGHNGERSASLLVHEVTVQAIGIDIQNQLGNPS